MEILCDNLLDDLIAVERTPLTGLLRAAQHSEARHAPGQDPAGVWSARPSARPRT
jgi:hypothetical protein